MTDSRFYHDHSECAGAIDLNDKLVILWVGDMNKFKVSYNASEHLHGQYLELDDHHIAVLDYQAEAAKEAVESFNDDILGSTYWVRLHDADKVFDQCEWVITHIGPFNNRLQANAYMDDARKRCDTARMEAVPYSTFKKVRHLQPIMHPDCLYQ